MNDRKGIYAALVLTALTYAGTPYFVKVAIENAPPMTVVFMRFSFAVFFLLPFVVKEKNRLHRPSKKTLARMVTLGILGMFLYHYLFFAALQYTSPLSVAIITSIMPLAASIIATIEGVERLFLSRIAMMLLSVVGILIVMSEGSIKTLQEIRFNRGDLMMLVGTLFFAWYNVGCRSILTKYPPLFTAFFFTVVTAAFSFPFFLQEVASVRWEAPSIWIAGVYTGLFPSALGLYIQQLGIQRIGVSRAVGFNNLIPVFSVVISLFVFGIDSVKPTHLVGMAIIIPCVLWNARIK